MDAFVNATLDKGEAVLRFPYDDQLRRLLRAIPGRRWDPAERAWIVPLDPERAEAVARLLDGMSRPPVLSDALGRALARQRMRRGHDECVLDVARPDESWWLTFATDRAPGIVEALLDTPTPSNYRYWVARRSRWTSTQPSSWIGCRPTPAACASQKTRRTR